MSAMRRLLWAAALSAVAVTGCALRRAPPGTSERKSDVDLPPVGSYTVATLGPYECTAINASGIIAGVSAAGRAVLIAPDGTVTDLGAPAGDAMVSVSSINASNQVVGTSSPATDGGPTLGIRAGLYSAGSWTALGFLGTGNQS